MLTWRAWGWLLLGPVLGWPVPTAAEPVLRLTPQEAVRRALQYNLNLKLERLDPALTTAGERIAEAAFHPRLFGDTSVAGSPGTVSAEPAGLSPTSTTSVGGDLGLRKDFSVGTSVEGRLSTSGLFGGGRGGLDPAYESALSLSARQALLQGNSRSANEGPIQSARLEREAATATLRRQAELVAADTLKSYWDLRAAVAKVAVQDVALQMTEQTLKETEALIGAGKLPASERASAAYAVQLQRRTRVQSERELNNVRDRMARIIGLVDPGSLATPPIVPLSNPRRTPPQWTLPELQRQAIAQRGDYRALQIQTKVRRTEEQVARNRLLPRLDVVAGLELTGLSGDASSTTGGSEEYSPGYWSSYALKRVGWTAGVSLEVPLGNVEAKARRDIAGVQVRRAELSVDVALQALSLELNLAWRNVQWTREQLRLTEEAVRLAESKLANETERYKAGKITAHILGGVQAEAITERLGREQALGDLVKAVVDMQAAAGGLLSRLGLSAEGETQP
jgi:outer membrane protein TolC